ncbi:MAG TPA: tetratricopeptide repeat protein, partial [Thermoanaerobaculia bacterium]|nr:tetratricopeptide repeat protein [Thermoanaerobaculia bacterium]
MALLLPRATRTLFPALLLAALGSALFAQPGSGAGGSSSVEPAPSVAEAERALGEGRVEEAAAAFRALVAELPDDPRLLAGLGRALALADRYGEAAEALERAVELGAGDLRTLLYLGSALWEAGRPDEAEPILERAAGAAAGTG